MEYAQLAEELKKDECVKHWGSQDLRIWLRDQCKCAYCDEDLLATFERAYYGYNYDHLLPKSAYKELESNELNLVLSCCTCNKIKATCDPNHWDHKGTRQEPLYDGKIFDPNIRSELIQRVRRDVTDYKAPYKARFAAEQSLLRKAVEERVKAASASSGL